MRKSQFVARFLMAVVSMVFLVVAAGPGKPGCGPAPIPKAPECATPKDCVGLPHILCLGQWECVDGACQWDCGEPVKGCYSDQDCGPGTHCSVSDGDCGVPPDCPMCTVCYGKCVPDKPKCVQSGCSGEVCAPEPVFTICLWKPWYACLKATKCGDFGPDGTCGFDLNPDFVKCVGENATCTSNFDCPAGFMCKNDSWCGDEGSWCAGGGKCVLAPEPVECQTDKDCKPGQVCKFEIVCPPCVYGDPPCKVACQVKGTCVEPEPPPPEECTSDLDCKPGYACVEESWCPECVNSDPACAMPCKLIHICKPLNQQCESDKDCVAGYFCDFSEGVCLDCLGCPCYGTCKPIQEPGCKSDADCPKGQKCDLSAECPPCDCPEGALCKCLPCAVPEYGKCVPCDDPSCGIPKKCPSDAACAPWEFCDFSGVMDVDGCCPPNAMCIPEIPPCDGVCKMKPGLCWTDADCKPGEKCEGAIICPPGAQCFVADQPGKCVQASVECTSDKDCLAGEFCELKESCPACYYNDPPCLAPCLLQGACKPLPGFCWTDADCKDGYVCEGAFKCPPGALCGPLPDKLGKCVPAEKCQADKDCPAGEYCNLKCGEGGCFGLCAPLPDGVCVKDIDCKGGFTCEFGPCPMCVGCPCFGKCVEAQPKCVPVKPGTHGLCEMILGVIFDGQHCVWESGCSCGADCNYFFKDFFQCVEACNPECWTDKDCPPDFYCEITKCDSGVKCVGPYQCKPKAVPL